MARKGGEKEKRTRENRSAKTWGFCLKLNFEEGSATKFVRTREFSKLTRFRNTENLVNPLYLDMDAAKTLSDQFNLISFDFVRTRRIGANPEKSDLQNFRGPD